MQVYGRIMDGSKFIDVPVKQDLGIVILHNGAKYTLSENNDGTLVLRSIDDTQIIIKPKAANSVEITKE